MNRKKTFKSYLFVTLLFLVVCVQSFAQSSPEPVGWVSINTPFTASQLKNVDQQLEQLKSESIQTIIFEFSGSGKNFERYSQLGRKITTLNRDDITTVAYIPESALGLTMIPVFACQQIMADEFAQIGMVLPLKDDQKVSSQVVLNKVVSFAEAAGHDPLIAKAMTDKKMVLYQVDQDGGVKLIDKKSYEIWQDKIKSVFASNDSAPIVSENETLLLNGLQAKKVGLVRQLFANKNECLEKLNYQVAGGKTDQASKEPNAVLASDGIPDGDGVEKVVFEDGQVHKVAVIICKDMVDEGMYISIKRRTEQAISEGATYIIYEIDTFGGALNSAISIWDYFMHDVSKRAHTVAYVPTKAISAGALISVACNDIIMKESTQIGDCAPIIMGGKLEGVEREKAESPTRSYFEAAAKANGYPVALCRAMVTLNIAVYKIKNLQTDRYEYFEDDQLPKDDGTYDLEGKTIVVKSDQLLTWDAEKAVEHGLARSVVNSRDEAIAFLAKRDQITFDDNIVVYETTWSEEMVRWLTSPTVAGILLTVGLLGIYAELNSPGLGIPGAIAVIAFAALFGSKYMINLANWWEILLFIIGFLLLTVEIFLIPGFGIAGFSGIVLIFFSLIAMMVANPSDQLPIPQEQWDWNILQDNFNSLLLSIVGFIIGASIISRYMYKIPMANKMVLNAPGQSESVGVTMTPVVEDEPVEVSLNEEGVSLTQLRPAGRAKFGEKKCDVVSRGEMIEQNMPVRVIEIEGNRIVVAPK